MYRLGVPTSILRIAKRRKRPRSTTHSTAQHRQDESVSPDGIDLAFRATIHEVHYRTVRTPRSLPPLLSLPVQPGPEVHASQGATDTHGASHPGV